MDDSAFVRQRATTSRARITEASFVLRMGEGDEEDEGEEPEEGLHGTLQYVRHVDWRGRSSDRRVGDVYAPANPLPPYSQEYLGGVLTLAHSSRAPRPPVHPTLPQSTPPQTKEARALTTCEPHSPPPRAWTPGGLCPCTSTRAPPPHTYTTSPAILTYYAPPSACPTATLRVRTPPLTRVPRPPPHAWPAAARLHHAGAPATRQKKAQGACSRWHRVTEVARGPALCTRPTKGSMGVFHSAGAPRKLHHTTRGSPQGRSGRR